MHSHSLFSTEFKDKNGVIIMSGNTVKHPDGCFGKVIFANGAWRCDAYGASELLIYNSSLLFCDNWKPEEFEVIK